MILTGIVGHQGLRKTRRRSVQCLFTSLTAATVAWQPSGRSLRFYRIRPAEPCGSVSFVFQQKGATISESNFFFVRSNRFCLRGKRVIVLFFCSMWATILNVSSVFVFVIPTRARNNFVQNIACSVQFMFSGQTFMRPDSFFFICYSPVRQHNLNYNK